MWQPSEKALKNVEVDEAGKLAAFRERFGRAFDAQQQAGAPGEDAAAAAAASGKQQAKAEAEDEIDYSDLISSYAPDMSSQMKEAPQASAPAGKKRK